MKHFRTKTILGVVAAFSCLSLFCVGFANWELAQGDSAVTGRISAEDVKNSEDFISLGAPVGLTYTADGFTGEDGNAYTAEVTVPVTVRLANLRSLFQTETTAKVTVTMRYHGAAPASASLFSEDYIRGEIKGLPSENTSSCTVANNAISVSATLALDDTDSVSLTAVFTVDLKDEKTFTDVFYSPLDGSALQFAFDATIEGGKS